MGIPWRGLVHDLSKFIPGEFIAYSCYYYENNIGSQRSDDLIDNENSAFYINWLIHQKRNRHHWQWWIFLHGNDDNPTVLPMADQYIKEMVADWRGAGKAQGEPDTVVWYQCHKSKMMLHPATQKSVEQLLYAERTYTNKAWPWGKTYHSKAQPSYGLEVKCSN